MDWQLWILEGQWFPHALIVSIALDRERFGAVLAGFAIEDTVEGQFEGVIKHARDDGGQPLVGEFYAGIGVDLDEPDMLLTIDHEVISKYLEVLGLALC